MIDLLIILTLGVLFFLIRAFFLLAHSPKWKTPKNSYPESWDPLLEHHINYYKFLNPEEKIRFRQRMHIFLFNVKITGIKTYVTELDKIRIAASAIIPVFSFPDWEYSFLEEVLLYPDDFTINIGEDESPKMKGLVSENKIIENKIMFSQKALEEGFQNHHDKLNVGIHEFVHFIDKADDQIDGIPKKLLQNDTVLEWINLMHSKISEILKDESDIRAYGSTHSAEFLAVTTEYFFERPIVMKKKHPKLYAFISTVYKQNPALKKKTFKTITQTKAQDKCPCGSGLAFKNCCMKYNIND